MSLNGARRRFIALAAFSTPKDLEDVSKYPNLFDALIERNATRWTQENLEKLAGRNLIRVFKKAEEVPLPSIFSGGKSNAPF